MESMLGNIGDYVDAGMEAFFRANVIVSAGKIFLGGSCLALVTEGIYYIGKEIKNLGRDLKESELEKL